MLKTSPSHRSGEILPDRARDYRLLLERWVGVCGRESGLMAGVFAEADGYPLLVVESETAEPSKPSLYISAGIHGDEPAPVEALIRWAEESCGKLRLWNLTIFPCLNPWGLERNIRFDAEGRDLNRCYNSRKVPRIVAQRAVLQGRRFDLALCLHEDYDARGFYLYEIATGRGGIGEAILSRIDGPIGPDGRRSIDGHSARGGVIRRRITPELLPGHPEAFLLHFHHAAKSLTFETPSEAALPDRVMAQKGFLDAATAGFTMTLSSAAPKKGRNR